MVDESRFFNDTDNGKIHIAPQVIEVITKHSTLEVDGVVALYGGFEFADLFGKNTKGIKVNLLEKDVRVDVSVVIKNGYNIPNLANRVQENVKNAIETMTDLDVIEVNLHINGIEFDDMISE